MRLTGMVPVLLLFISTMGYGQRKQQAAQLDSIFSLLYKQYQFNGVVLVAEKGTVIYKKGFGKQDEQTGALNTVNTPFELASCTKQFTAGGIVLLHRQGKLQYTDKLSQYIPELKHWDAVTIYDLLRHTSGIPEYLIDMDSGWDKTKIATNQDVINFYAARKDTLQFVPQSRHRYNNTNYVLLATIIERVSGKDMGSYLTDNIFKPLGMKSTRVYNSRQNSQKWKKRAVGYVWGKGSFNKVTPEHSSYGDSSVYYLDGVVGAAKVSSTVGDILKWLTALKTNSFFTKAEFEEMTAITQTSAGKKIPYGFGLDVAKGENKFSYGHTGNWDAYVSLIYHNVIKDRSIIVLQNFSLGAYPYDNIVQVLEGKPLVEEYKKKVTIPETVIQQYTGTYVDEKNAEELHLITYKEGHLFYNTQKLKWDMRFFPVSENTFQGIRQGGRDGVLRFTRLPGGELKMEMLEYDKVIGSGILKQ
jgi:CubicO group peptidase (beta-lactamase class C family)